MANSQTLIEDQMRTTNVGVADFKLSTDPLTYLATYGLGSCLGVTFYDEKRKIGGLLHAMLPSARLHEGKKIKETMFLDTGVKFAMGAMERAGAKISQMEVKVFGGAQLIAADRFFRIGSKNIDAFYQISQELELNVTAWEVSGRVNRTIRLNNHTGEVIIKVPAKPDFIR